MANFDTNLFRKKNRHRGLYGGKFQSVTGVLRVAVGQSIATADLIRAVPLGENTKPLRIVIHATTVSGNPTLVNPTFDVGVAPLLTTNFKRPDGTEYVPPAANPAGLSVAAVLDADRMFTDIEILDVVAASVPKYGPYVVTLKPAGAGAFSVTGGDIDLKVTVEYIGEITGEPFVYTEFVNQKVKN